MDIDPFINKRVTFRFARQTLLFDLSQALFSSFDVDTGTRLLLKTVVRQVDLPSLRSVLDVGCGVGVIGVSLKKVNADLTLTVQDRDGLALAFTRHNARLNQVGAVDVPGGLALQGLDGRTFDLIVSNLPGKAGESVLADMLTRLPRFLTASGVAAVVIVKPLADFVARTLQHNDSVILLREVGKGHVVFHCRGGREAAGDVTLAPYLRDQHHFAAPGAAYELQTAHNLPEFDTLSHQTKLAMKVMADESVYGRLLTWHPGPGHWPVYAHHRWGTAVTQQTVAGRDGLGLAVSQLNLQGQGAAVQMVHCAALSEVAGQFDWVTLFLERDTAVFWQQQVAALSRRLLAPDGRLLLAGKSALLQRLLPDLAHLSRVSDKRRHGFRAVLLRSES